VAQGHEGLARRTVYWLRWLDDDHPVAGWGIVVGDVSQPRVAPWSLRYRTRCAELVRLVDAMPGKSSNKQAMSTRSRMPPGLDKLGSTGGRPHIMSGSPHQEHDSRIRCAPINQKSRTMTRSSPAGIPIGRGAVDRDDDSAV
jgi:hypothetical protein